MKEKVFRRAGKRVLNVSEKAGVFTLIKFLIRKPDKRRGVFSFLQMFACFNVELFKCFPVPSFFRVPCEERISDREHGRKKEQGNI